MPIRPEEGTGSLELGEYAVVSRMECWELNSDLLEVQLQLLSSEASLPAPGTLWITVFLAPRTVPGTGNKGNEY